MLVNNAELLPRLDPRPVIKRLAHFILTLHMPENGYSPTHHRVPFEEPGDGLWTHQGHIQPEDIFDHKDYQPPCWIGLPYYTGDPTVELSVEEIRQAGDNQFGPRGERAVYDKGQFQDHLDGSV